MDNLTIHRRERLRTENKLENFLQTAYLADGRLIPLPKINSRIGEPLFVSVRYGQDASLPEKDHYYLNIDVFALREDDYIPVGMRDYEIRDNIANGNKNRHQHLPNTSRAHDLADNYWTIEGVKVAETDLLQEAASYPDMLAAMSKIRSAGLIAHEDDWNKKIYQEMGIGSFMTALALKVLENKGVEIIEFVTLTRKAKSLWKKFGVNDLTLDLDISVAANHEYTQKSLAKFIL